MGQFKEAAIPQRVVIVDGLASHLLFGDVEQGDRRFETNGPEGHPEMGVLPMLLNEGWLIKMAVPMPTVDRPRTLVVLQTGEPGDDEDFEDDYL